MWFSGSLAELLFAECVRACKPELREAVVERTEPGGHRLASMGKSAIRYERADFGTYHHSTPEESREIRERAGEAFSGLLKPLYPLGAPLRIMDAGCGLGFLAYIAAECFPKAVVTGVDLFKHGSISGISIDKAAQNMKSLGLESRTSFLKHDLTKPFEADGQYDLVISNLVFHNLGKQRFKGYRTVLDVLKPGGFFVIGDLFRRGKGDVDSLLESSTLIATREEGSSGPWEYQILVLRKHIRRTSKSSRQSA